jgi:hypothetical protein
MLSVVTWKWGTKFKAKQVNTLRAMVKRNYRHPHRFICVTDDAEGIDDDIELIPDWADFTAVESPHGGIAPSCYRRLRAFHPDIATYFGDRFVVLDLDTVVIADLTPLWNRPGFVGWQDPIYPNQLNGSMLLMSAGYEPSVWDKFIKHPFAARAEAYTHGFRGSDQAWISYCLEYTQRWTAADGVLSYRFDCVNELPAHARIVFFHGAVKPWSLTQLAPWVEHHYWQ